MKKFSTVQEIQAERQNQRANDIIYTMLGVLLGEIDRLLHERPLLRTRFMS